MSRKRILGNANGATRFASNRIELIQNSIPLVVVLLQTSLKVCRDVLEGIHQYERLYGPWRFHIIEDYYNEPIPWRDGNAPGTFGMIVFAQSRESAKLVRSVRCPAVLIDPVDEYFPGLNLAQSQNFGMLKYDSSEVGRIGARFLLDKQFSHFAYIDDATGFNWSRSRGDAFCQTIQESGRNCHRYHVSPTKERRHPEQELDRLAAWIRALPKPVAIMAARDIRARQVLNICVSEGISVPHQAAVLGVDNDVTLCRATWPPLSSIQMESKRAGFLVSELLANMMQMSRIGQTVANRLVHCEGGFVEERASTDSLCVENKWVSSALEYIKINAEQGIGVEDVVHFLCISRRQLETLFKVHLDRTIVTEINRVRCQKACSLLANTDLSMAEIAPLCGYDNESYMGKVFKKVFGQTMSSFRRRNRVIVPRGQRREPDTSSEEGV